MGDYTLDASGCGPRGCVTGASYLATLGSREISRTLEAKLASEESSSRSCASVLPGWMGTFNVRCSYGALTGDASGCSPAACSAGLSATIVVGTTAADTSITAEMASSSTETRNCEDIDSTYEGTYSLICEAAALSSNTTACTPKPVEGTTIEARQVVESAVAFNLPEVTATVEEMQAQMELPATKRAYELTLAETLEIPSEDVTVFSIQVYDPTTAARRLQTVTQKTSLAVNVNFQLRTKGSTDTAQATQVTGLKTKIASLGTSGSTVQWAFASALGTNLEEAAKVDPDGMALLRLTAQAVQTEGVVVKHVETPRISVTYVAIEVIPDEEGNPMLVINIIAALMGIAAAGACAVLVIWQVRKRQVLTPVAMLDGDAVQEVDAEAPESPTSHHTESPNTVAIRSAGQTSPQSLAMRNAVNNTAAVEPTFSPFGPDPSPFWEDPVEVTPGAANAQAPPEERMVTLDGDQEMGVVSVDDQSNQSITLR